MTRIAFIRHGITLWNLEKRAQGQTNIPLNEMGRMQAFALAKHLEFESWDNIFSSDLLRAKETAEVIASVKGLKLQTDIRLREMYKGETEGTTLEERLNKWGKEWDKLPLGIEESQSIISRGISFINEVLETLSGKNILIVSHGALIELLLQTLVSNFQFEGPINNTSITIIKKIDLEWKCESFNNTRHLESLIEEGGSIR